MMKETNLWRYMATFYSSAFSAAEKTWLQCVSHCHKELPEKYLL